MLKQWINGTKASHEEKNGKKTKPLKRIRRIKQHNSWIFVIFASIVDIVLIIPLPGNRGGTPIIGLSDSLGSLGKKRQEKLLIITVGTFGLLIVGIIIAGIVAQFI